MYQIFTKVEHPNYGLNINPKWNYYKRMLHRELIKVTDYYRTRKFLIDNRNVFIRLVRSLYTPISYDDVTYLRVVESKAKYFTKTIGFTSEISKGLVHNGFVYGPGSEEIFIYDESPFSLRFFSKNWKEAVTAKALDHPISDLMLTLPDGSRKHTDIGISVIKVHVGQLMLQYKYFRRDRERYSDPLMKEVGDHVFVTQYVLNNMLGHHLDMAILNRMMNIYYGAPMGGSVKHLPFTTDMLEGKIDKYMEEMMYIVRNKNMRYDAMLSNIPAATKTNMLEVLHMPDMARTMQIDWALLLTRLRHMLFVVDLGGERNKKFNKDLITQLKRDVYIMSSDYGITDRYKGELGHTLNSYVRRVDEL